MSWLERNAGLIAIGVAVTGVGLLMLLLLREPTENDIRVLLKEHAAFRNDNLPRASKITCGYGAVYFERRDGEAWVPAQLEDEKGNIPFSGAPAKGTWYVPPGIIRVRVEP